MYPRSSSPVLRLLPLLLLALALPVVASDRQRQVDAQKRLQAVRQQIHALTLDQRQAAARRDKLNAALSRQADTLAAAARAVRQTDTQIAAQQQRIDALDRQQAAARKHLDGQRQALGELLRAAYAMGHSSDLRLLLDDEDVGRIARALAYSRYFQHDRVQRIRALMQDLARLQDAQQALVEAKQQLESERTRRQQRADTLGQARRHQQQLLADAEAQLKSRQQKLDALRRREKSLDALVARLRDVFADIPASLPSDVAFAKLRGKLPWPARGAARSSGAGEVIHVARGSDVHAVAHGRVAYAGWLRGYGMLVIVDHGHNWMTLYGNNESVLKSVGDWVNPGDVIATSGAGADGRNGVYFELRHDGKPVNPRPWLRRR